MHLSFTTLDVFTCIPYTGNPLAVIRVPFSLRHKLSEAQKQKVAREFNLSEVTFLHEPVGTSTSTSGDASEEGGTKGENKGDEVAEFDIFTPLARVSFAGHPTIGTALWIAEEQGRLQSDNLSTRPSPFKQTKTLRTVAGSLPLAYSAGTGRATVKVPFAIHLHAATLPHPFPYPAPSSTTSPSPPTVPIFSIVKGMAFALCQLSSLDDLGRVTGPLLPAGQRFEGRLLDGGSGWDVGYTGSFYYVDLGVVALDSDEAKDYCGEMEAGQDKDEQVRRLRTRSYPAHEDPGTGSASAALACFISLKERKEQGLSGRRKFWFTQGVEMGRRCDIFVDVDVADGKGGVVGVELSGCAVRVMEGVVSVPDEQ